VANEKSRIPVQRTIGALELVHHCRLHQLLYPRLLLAGLNIARPGRLLPHTSFFC
jgi:hypothetical protein